MFLLLSPHHSRHYERYRSRTCRGYKIYRIVVDPAAALGRRPKYAVKEQAENTRAPAHCQDSPSGI